MNEHREEPPADERVEDLAVPEGESEDVKGGLSLNFTKIEFKAQKVAPSDVITGAGPGGGPH